MTGTGLPHSEIPGSKVVCTSPRLFAAYHVFHRLHVPRHPPYALSSFTKVSFLFMCYQRSEERRVGKSVDLGGRRIIKKKKKNEKIPEIVCFNDEAQVKG